MKESFFDFLRFNSARHFIKENLDLNSYDFVTKVIQELSLQIEVKGSIPTSLNKTVIVSNHPFGGVDAIVILYLFLKHKDIKLVGNKIFLMFPQLKDKTIPVHSVSSKRINHQSMKLLLSHIKMLRPFIIFPSGTVMRKNIWWEKKEYHWSSVLGKLIIRNKLNVLPVGFKGENSTIFYLISLFSKRLSFYFLIRELYLKQNSTIQLSIGRLIRHEDLPHKNAPKNLTSFLRKEVLNLISND